MQHGVFAFRVNNGAIYDKNINGYRRLSKFHIKGTSDIIGLCDGTFFCIEVKDSESSAKASAKRQPEQLIFIEKVKREKGFGCVAWELKQVEELIHDIRLARTCKGQ